MKYVLTFIDRALAFIFIIIFCIIGLIVLGLMHLIGFFWEFKIYEGVRREWDAAIERLEESIQFKDSFIKGLGIAIVAIIVMFQLD